MRLPSSTVVHSHAQPVIVISLVQAQADHNDLALFCSLWSVVVVVVVVVVV